ncbi:MAG: hypothetical protein ACNA76_10075, partial [Anaerosomatales bacterium]
MPAAWRVHVLREGLREAGIDAEVVERDLMALEGAQRQVVLDVMIGQDLDPQVVHPHQGFLSKNSGGFSSSF